ncbi:MAG: hypothetical protein AAF570_22045 [Bacteroidota bacterium]
MKTPKPVLRAALIAALETSLLLTPLGVLIFLPFVMEYDLLDMKINLLYSGLLMCGSSLALALLVLVPTTYVIENTPREVSRKELTGSLGTMALSLVLVATLLYKGFEAPGNTGKLLLFSLLMSIMVVTWTFALRYDRKSRLFESESSS